MMPQYVPRVSAECVEQLRRWHDHVSSELHARPTVDMEYLGLQLHVPHGVFAPTPTSDLLGNLVTDHAAPSLRMLDMGCGAGANAILAAKTGATVLAVDVNPAAVEASRANAARNGVFVRRLTVSGAGFRRACRAPRTVRPIQGVRTAGSRAADRRF
jgi:release factor glutamine methyltransferase